ncbi:DUF3783 domain-containing protein [Succiniclasticum ruminis]|uniref:DUF3783 domain-containing protein n=1 Tax=Succiniclasticum ruminis DSM 9236 TaxID=1123323 RepID=A0A1I2A7C3_9FIRM|nr:DUF3783 domain-containing protein [Succiniclasticum ruminis]SFE38833.1 protein of unknown function [Succiniclasticum ruminis DSM 9236]
MIKSVLAYNFNPERLQQLRQICMILKVNFKAVEPEQFDDAVGFLAGVKDCPQAAANPPEKQEEQLFEALEEAAQKAGEDPETVKKEAAESLAQAAQKEMVFLCGFDMHLLNRFLAAVKKGKLKSIELKAMLTPSNRQWSGRHLLQELAAEHVYMKQYGKSVHK